MLVVVAVAVGGQSSRSVFDEPREGLRDEEDAMVGAASTSEELRTSVKGKPVLKGMPVPVQVAPWNLVLFPQP